MSVLSQLQFSANIHQFLANIYSSQPTFINSQPTFISSYPTFNQFSANIRQFSARTPCPHQAKHQPPPPLWPCYLPPLELHQEFLAIGSWVRLLFEVCGGIEHLSISRQLPPPATASATSVSEPSRRYKSASQRKGVSQEQKVEGGMAREEETSSQHPPLTPALTGE
jgi:hypothetical protein